MMSAKLHLGNYFPAHRNAHKLNAGGCLLLGKPGAVSEQAQVFPDGNILN